MASALVATLACASSPVAFRGSTATPAATGQMRAELDDNGNSWVELEIAHLASPENLHPARKVYVLWAESHFGRQVLLGQLRPDDRRGAEWRGTVPFDHFRLLVSAEDLPWPERPRDPIVMQTEYVEAR